MQVWQLHQRVGPNLAPVKTSTHTCPLRSRPVARISQQGHHCSKREERCACKRWHVPAAASRTAESGNPEADVVEEKTIMPGSPDDMIAKEAMGMGTWRLRPFMGDLFQLMCGQIETSWRHQLGFQMGLFPLPKDLRYCDSAGSPDKEDAWNFAAPSPERGQPGWPRLRMENRAYFSRAFRKLHLECVFREDGLQILHCVMFPRLNYDLPILGLDMVGKDDLITLAITDFSPVSKDRSLPEDHTKIAQQLQAEFGLESNRSMPQWGKEIFSDQCISIRPTNGKVLDSWIKYTLGIVNAHLLIANETKPVPADRSDKLQELQEQQQRYCHFQLQNDRTRRVLQSAFGDETAERYLQQVLFADPLAEDLKSPFD